MENSLIHIHPFTVPVGAEAPFSALHTSDNHISLADARNDARKIELARQRANLFTQNRPELLTECTEAIFAYAKEHHLPLLHTGDLIDFVSEANLDYVQSVTRDVDFFGAAGNHEFSLYVGEAWEDEAYKAQSFSHVQEAFPGDLHFQTRILNGVRFIAMDTNYYYITEELFALFRQATAAPMPTVLLTHTPLYSEDLYRQCTSGKPADAPPYLLGCPEPLLRSLNDHRYRQQKPDACTQAFLDYCNQLSCLKAILAGHLHESFVSHTDSGIPQYVVGAGYKADVNLYTFI